VLALVEGWLVDKPDVKQELTIPWLQAVVSVVVERIGNRVLAGGLDLRSRAQRR
jgi:hypothetical protein